MVRVMSKKKVVALGGDGVGPEVVNATCFVFENAGFDLEVIKPPCGEKALGKYHDAFPEETRQICDSADAILFGAAGTVSGVILAYLRWMLDNYINIRPVKYYQGVTSCLKEPEGIDFVILRENSEGMYSFLGGDLSTLQEKIPDLRNRMGRSINDYGSGKFALRIASEKGTRRLVEFACDFTLQRKKSGYPGKIACPTKSNVIPTTDGLFAQIVKEEVDKYPELTFEHYYADDMARRILRFPREIDVIVAENMFGDILADEAAELIGGLGLAGSACLGGKIAYFESVHGSAPDIAGKNIVNPTATILSAKLMLDYLGMHAEATALDRAVMAVYSDGRHLTADQGGSVTTTEFAEAILNEIK